MTKTPTQEEMLEVTAERAAQYSEPLFEYIHQNIYSKLFNELSEHKRFNLNNVTVLTVLIALVDCVKSMRVAGCDVMSNEALLEQLQALLQMREDEEEQDT
jgi:hypothetical protein